MTKPLLIAPGKTYLITRNTRGRHFFLVPDDPVVTDIFKFCAARAAELSGVSIHAICVMSTHVHIVLTDTQGALPIFTQWFFRHTALCLKSLRGIDENLWSAERHPPVELLTPEAVIDAMAYVITNPTTANLVAHYYQWPGWVSAPQQMLAERSEQQPVPEVYFKNTKVAGKLKLTVPELAMGQMDRQEVVEAVEAMIEQYEEDAKAKRQSEGKKVLGRQAVIATDPFDRARPRPSSGGAEEDEGDGLVPRFKARCREALKEARERLKWFWQAYREAYESLRAGEPDVVFPFGTWWYREYLGVLVTPAY